APFALTANHKIATGGSCFSQHIARYLRDCGFNHLVTEKAHPITSDADASKFNYGIFTARYGNIYTARQLLQLFHRVFGKFVPADDVWTEADGRLVDPFRPQIQPGGFESMLEYRTDRERHFSAVRQAFQELDVFVFTLGLTESWRHRKDGAVYPLCPGVVGGEFN